MTDLFSEKNNFTQTKKMTTISKENNYLTLINVFTVETENQQKLVDLLILATKNTVRNIEGFISSSLHKSLDGTKVTMYAQWKSIEDYQNMRNNSTASPYLEEALKIAKFEMGMYEVVETFLPESE
jgi:quinol monooxygenase YgiN